jgi:pyruvate carboxylase subunit B
MSDTSYRADLDERSFDLAVTDEEDLVLNQAPDGVSPDDISVERVGPGYLSLLVDGTSVSAAVEPLAGNRYRVTINGRMAEVHVKDERAMLLESFGLEAASDAGEAEIRAPMPGLVLDVLVSEGDTVEADEGLLVLEAMKMENELSAPGPGTVDAIYVGEGDAVDKGTLLIELDLEA